jgi:hypothetical protein
MPYRFTVTDEVGQRTATFGNCCISSTDSLKKIITKCMLYIQMVMLMGRDYISELQSPTGLSFIPQVIHEHREPWWNNIDRAWVQIPLKAWMFVLVLSSSSSSSSCSCHLIIDAI